LRALYTEGSKRDLVEIFEVYKEKNILGSALFITAYGRKIFLFSALNEKGRKNRAMFFLVNEIIKKNSGNSILLDFEGSDNPSLGDFYRRFGAKEKLYLHLKINRLPLLLKRFKD
jgi:hypothetical protein